LDVSEDALHVDLEHPVARPAGLALLAVLALVGFANGFLPRVWSDLSVDQAAPMLAGDNIARPLIEDPTPPVLAIAPKAPAAPPRAAAKPVEEIATLPAAVAVTGADASALAAPPPAEAPPAPRAPAVIGEPVPAEPSADEGVDPPSY
jgi:hypothetical protein